MNSDPQTDPVVAQDPAITTIPPQRTYTFTLIILITLFIVISGALYFFMNAKTSTGPVLEDVASKSSMPIPNTETAETKETSDSSIEKIRERLLSITPQFFSSTGNDYTVIPLPQDMRIIRDELYAIITPVELGKEKPQYYDPSELILLGVGKRYILNTILVKKGGGSYDQIFDSVTQQMTPFVSKQGDAYQQQFRTDTVAVYLVHNNICIYRLDSPACIEIPGAQLAEDEMYGYGELGDTLRGVVETHTDNSFTVSVFKRDMNGDLAKVRDTVFDIK